MVGSAHPCVGMRSGVGSSAPKGSRSMLIVAMVWIGRFNTREGSSDVSRFERMKAPGRKLKGKRGPKMSFGELIRKLLQPEPEELEPKVATEKQRKPAAKGKRIRNG